MALQTIVKNIIEYKDGLLASSLIGLSVPILNRLESRQLVAAQVVTIGTQLGTQCWVSFVGGPTMFANMDRLVFGDIQSKLFPKYGLVNSSLSFIAFMAYRKFSPDGSLTSLLSPGLDLILSFLPCLLNYTLVFPITAKYMYDLRDAKKSNDKDLIKRAGMRFGLSHSLSLVLNFIPMMANLHFLYTMSVDH